MKVNGAAVKQSADVKVAVTNGAAIAVELVSPDGSSTSTYTVKIATA
jgi:hypothetical protein